jgi:hypothetical protein
MRFLFFEIHFLKGNTRLFDGAENCNKSWGFEMKKLIQVKTAF